MVSFAEIRVESLGVYAHPFGAAVRQLLFFPNGNLGFHTVSHRLAGLEDPPTMGRSGKHGQRGLSYSDRTDAINYLYFITFICIFRL